MVEEKGWGMSAVVGMWKAGLVGIVRIDEMMD